MMTPSLSPVTAGPVFARSDRSTNVGPRVLLATSGSAASRRATVVAVAIAGEHNGQLIVVHVRPPVLMRVTRLGPAVAPPGWLDDPMSDAVLLAARRLAWENGVLPRVGLLAGAVAKAVVLAARQLDVGLIVIGSRIARRPTRMSQSIHARVRRSGAAPVLAVPLAPSGRGGQAFNGERETRCRG